MPNAPTDDQRQFAKKQSTGAKTAPDKASTLAREVSKLRARNRILSIAALAIFVVSVVFGLLYTTSTAAHKAAIEEVQVLKTEIESLEWTNTRLKRIIKETNEMVRYDLPEAALDPNTMPSGFPFREMLSHEKDRRDATKQTRSPDTQQKSPAKKPPAQEPPGSQLRE